MGKRLKTDWQNAWIVMIFIPSGTSSTWARSRRARFICEELTESWVRRVNLLLRSLEFETAQLPSSELILCAISAAAAFVKVRQSTR